jgi:NADP-dependent 3-hydroxy acid dehydrogenase YdfG
MSVSNSEMQPSDQSGVASEAVPKVAVVTGASSGIGRAIARRLAHDGYAIAICARRQDRLTQLAHELKEIGSKVLDQAVDLHHEAEILSFFDRIRITWGGLMFWSIMLAWDIGPHC